MQAHGWVLFQGTSTGFWALQGIFHINKIVLNQIKKKKKSEKQTKILKLSLRYLF